MLLKKNCSNNSELNKDNELINVEPLDNSIINMIDKFDIEDPKDIYYLMRKINILTVKMIKILYEEQSMIIFLLVKKKGKIHFVHCPECKLSS